MSVKGFKINGVTEKYDYGSLDNKAVGTEDIVDEAVTANKLASDAVTEAKINDGAVTTNKLASNSVTEVKINDGAVTANKLASNSVTEAKINDGAVTTNKLASNSVTEAKINDEAVTANKLASNAVTTNKLASNSVTEAKINDGAVTTNKLASNSVTEAKLGSDVASILSNKANVDGVYEQMTVGLAEQLQSDIGIEDKIPYNFRTSGGAIDIGDRERVDSIVGGTVCWNQLVNGTNASSFIRCLSGDSIEIYSESTEGSPEATVLAGARFGGVQTNETYSPLDIPTGDKVLALADVRLSDAFQQIRLSVNAQPDITAVAKSNTNWQTLGIIVSWDASKSSWLRVRDHSTGDSFSPFYVKNCMVFDLTLMFGFQIADYVYSLEQANVGDGVMWFKNLFQKDYYAYNSGELMSVRTSAHKMIGFNAYNNITGKAKVVAHNAYQITGGYTALSLLSSGSAVTTITPDESGYFIPSESGEITVTGGNSTNTCIHLKWDGEMDGEYKAYEEWNYTLDSSLELRGFPKLDDGSKLYYDGDLYNPDGTVIRKYGVVDLGTLTWAKPTTVTNYMNFYSAGISSVVERPLSTATSYGTIICEKYPNGPITQVGDNYIYVTTTGQIRVKDTANDSLTAEEFKTLMSGVYAVYLLATPVVETADGYRQTQDVSDWGTEEYIDNRAVAIPVGHTTFYQANLKAKLEMAPNSPSGDGLYAVRQSRGINSYEKILLPTPVFTIMQHDSFSSWTSGSVVQAFAEIPAEYPNALLATYITVPDGNRVALYETRRTSSGDHIYLQSAVIGNPGYYVACNVTVGDYPWQAEFTMEEV